MADPDPAACPYDEPEGGDDPASGGGGGSAYAPFDGDGGGGGGGAGLTEVAALRAAWQNERQAPEVLPYRPELVDGVTVRRLSHGGGGR